MRNQKIKEGNKIDVSIIIVHYKVEKELFDCLKTIKESNAHYTYEVIIVDNDDKQFIAKDLRKHYSWVTYIRSSGNIGFGAGNNHGAKIAKGEFLFFLNPDTTIFPDTINKLVNFLKKNRKAGIVAPLLHDIRDKVYQQGSRELTPLNGVFALSFINKLFPNNSISNAYWLREWDQKSIYGVDVVPGTAFVIRKDIFEKIRGFDEKLFLYFEEFDLCTRVKKLGWKIYINPQAKVLHAWGSSTKKSTKNIKQIFAQSRFYYFKKHFGVIHAFIVEAFLRINKYTALLALFLVLGIFLRTYRIQETMEFIGDQGWFYLSARNMLMTGKIPLVGIPSSHPWLHQGALWTYLLAGSLWLFHFNPLGGAYLTVFIDTITIFLFYKFGSEMFSQKLGLIAALLYAISPLTVLYARMPYHTSLIPFFTVLLIYFLYKWVGGNKYYFPLIIADLAILYNFELATALLGIAVCIVFLYGLFTRQKWIREVPNLELLFLSILAFVVPMLPMLIYDSSHGFVQTLGFLAWLGYKTLLLLGLLPANTTAHIPAGTMIKFASEQYTRFIFPYSSYVAFVILLLSTCLFFIRIKNKPSKRGLVIIGIVNIVTVVGLFASNIPSGAYIPMLVPGFILLTSFFFSEIINHSFLKYPVVLALACIVLFNSYYLYNYLSKGDVFRKRLQAAQYILKNSQGTEYNIIGEGPASQFASFTMNYEYLTWWLGHGPSENKQPLRFVISETRGNINVRKELLNKIY